MPLDRATLELFALFFGLIVTVGLAVATPFYIYVRFCDEYSWQEVRRKLHGFKLKNDNQTNLLEAFHNSQFSASRKNKSADILYHAFNFFENDDELTVLDMRRRKYAYSLGRPNGTEQILIVAIDLSYQSANSVPYVMRSGNWDFHPNSPERLGSKLPRLPVDRSYRHKLSYCTDSIWLFVPDNTLEQQAQLLDRKICDVAEAHKQSGTWFWLESTESVIFCAKTLDYGDIYLPEKISAQRLQKEISALAEVLCQVI